MSDQNLSKVSDLPVDQVSVPLIKAEKLVKRYVTGENTVTALNHLSIEIPKGKLTILRGKSGSGKTTFLNAIGALDYPDEGSILFDGEEISTLSPHDRDKLRRWKMGFVFQSIALMGDMTAYENIDFNLRIAGMSYQERKERVLECLTLVGLSDRANHLPQELSGGEQQRIAIARAISHKPMVVLADEPTAQLDTQMALRIVRLFLDLVEKEGITVVMLTHDPEMVAVAHKVYTLSDGEVIDEHE